MKRENGETETMQNPELCIFFNNNLRDMYTSYIHETRTECHNRGINRELLIS
jgi:hypothetical protein